jgi:3-deoxy-D-manno-octulosonate 8-phosphate phosphatase (KDO 8-P phosphatase)
LARHRVKEEDSAFIGDDIPDLSILRTVGMAVAVANSVPEVLGVAHVKLTRGGGAGAIREFAELLLKARGEWEQAVEQYIAERGGNTQPDKPRARSRR